MIEGIRGYICRLAELRDGDYIIFNRYIYALKGCYSVLKGMIAIEVNNFAKEVDDRIF